MQNKDFSFEAKRKIFHLSSLFIPILYLFVSKFFIVSFLLIMTVIVMYLDVSRHYNSRIKKIIDQFCIKLIRAEEQSGNFVLSGASFMFLGFLTTALLFPKGLAITCFFILIVCDCVAALVGTKIGIHKYSNNKTLEGSITFFVSSILISLLCYYYMIPYDTSFFIIIVNSFIVTFVEFYSSELSVNDNFIIPVAYGAGNSLLAFLI